MRLALILGSALLLGLVGCGDKPAAPDGSGTSEAGASGGGGETIKPAALDKKAIDAAIAKGRAYLVALVNEEGAMAVPGLPEPAYPSFTAMGALALVASTPKGEVEDDATIRKMLDYMLRFQDEKSGALIEKTNKTNYATSVLVSALVFARIKDLRENLVKARAYIEESQIRDEQANLSYGGFPYKQAQGQPSDLSNGQFALDALHAAEREGMKADPKLWERARVYLDRVQNRSESNTGRYRLVLEDETEAVATAGDDGGAYYLPGESKAGVEKRPNGTYLLHSYGSMTYALLKCLLFAGVPVDDPRVEAAIGWIQNNWTLDRNPGFKEDKDLQGYFYYLATVARALSEYERYSGKPFVVRDAAGEPHDWRAELVAKLLELQRPDGSWVNTEDRWNEGLPALTTAYALQALAFVSGRLP